MRLSIKHFTLVAALILGACSVGEDRAGWGSKDDIVIVNRSDAEPSAMMVGESSLEAPSPNISELTKIGSIKSDNMESEGKAEVKLAALEPQAGEGQTRDKEKSVIDNVLQLFGKKEEMTTLEVEPIDIIVDEVISHWEGDALSNFIDAQPKAPLGKEKNRQALSQKTFISKQDIIKEKVVDSPVSSLEAH